MHYVLTQSVVLRTRLKKMQTSSIWDVSASMVTYHNDVEWVNKAIHSFLNTNLNVHIFVVDNAETTELKHQLPNDVRITYQYSGGNIGFGAGHNLAIKQVANRSKYHLILNPDVVWQERNLLEKLFQFAQKNPEVGALMPLVKYPDGSTQLLAKLLPSPIDLIFRRFVPFLANPKFDLAFTGYNRIMEVPFLSGCFLFIPTPVLAHVGGFDERYFMYCEDIDLCRRINAQYKNIFFPDVAIVHQYAKASYKNKKLLRIHITSAIKYFNKWGWIFDGFRREINRKTLAQFTQKGA